MKFYNGEIKDFLEIIINLNAVGRESRMRTRFAELLEDRLRQLSKEYDKLVEEFAEKDEQGRPVKVENGIKVKNTAEFQAEFDALITEEVVIDETEERKAMFLSVRDTLLNSKNEYKDYQAFVYDRLCTLFEQLEYESDPAPVKS